jgi:glutathione S-transferase
MLATRSEETTMAGELTFYTTPMSRGRTVRWLLEELAAPYDTVLIDLMNKDHAFRAINPMMKVPAVVHDGRTVTETAAICVYLAEAFPQAGLAPTAEERADYYRWMFFAAGPFEQATVNQALGVQVPADKQMMVGYGSVDRVADAVEQALLAHPFIAGDRFTAADVYFGSQLGWTTGVGMLPKRDIFDAYLGRIMGRPAAVRARQIDDTLIAEGKA